MIFIISFQKSRTVTAKRAHLNYMFSESFADGSAFSASMIDTLLYQTFVKDYMIDLIGLAIGLKQTMGSGYLTSVRFRDFGRSILPKVVGAQFKDGTIYQR